MHTFTGKITHISCLRSKFKLQCLQWYLSHKVVQSSLKLDSIFENNIDNAYVYLPL